jgi:hypothetical protein
MLKLKVYERVVVANAVNAKKNRGKYQEKVHRPPNKEKSVEEQIGNEFLFLFHKQVNSHFCYKQDKH